MIWLQSISKLQAALVTAEDNLSTLPSEPPYCEFEYVLQGLGFERGWGDTTAKVLELIHLLRDIVKASDPTTLKTFLGKVPMVFNDVILSPHGYFGQENVLGLPDTDGQVVYILDQVCALENERRQKVTETTCNQRLERVTGTEHSHILRVPFRSENGILRKWISRFDVWSYLETFAEDVAGETTAKLQGHPDFIIGNYSYGNLVASLLAYKMGVTQCTIAHALEKTKYPDSDIY
ncbi:putative sucrose synthase [Rosa chinensis]|uniref:sucrose synthase n=1 Tax=Rosa chinensis TaxID=74649 RepID=A0A2P6R9R3_ROSCH|nr:sucrose synthase 2 [Rosa chinensis]PRQ43155.1 putative sucrose synthase [Rosa chinensis]